MAQTCYGTTHEETVGNTTTITCIPGAQTICQIWGNNADGSRYVIVRTQNPDGSWTDTE